MHESPNGPRLEARVIRRAKHGIPLSEIRFVEEDGVEPVVTPREWRLDEKANAGNRHECLGIALCESPLVGEEPVQLFKLRASEGSIEIGKAIVEADGVVDVLPAVRHLGLGAHVLRSRSQLFVIGDDGTPASRGDRLVAVEAERANTPDSARVTAFVVRPDAFRGVLNEHDSVSLAYLDQRVE